MKIHRVPKSLTFVFLSLFSFTPSIFAQWQPDTRLTYDDSVSRTPCLAVDSSGTVLTAWSDDRDGGLGQGNIFGKRSTDSGTTWSRDTNLTFAPGDSRFPALAASGLTFHLVWQEKAVPNWEIHYKRSTDGGATWSQDTTLSEVTSDTAGSWNPTVAVQGKAVHVAWADARSGSGAPDIYYKYSSDGGASWGLDRCLTTGLGISANPSIAASGDTVHLVWSDDRTGNDNIYYKRSTDRGAIWGRDTALTYSTSPGTNPVLSASGSRVHLAWVNDGQDVFYKFSGDNGNHWTAGTRLAAGTGAFPSISASGSNVHIAWVDNRDGNFEIYYKSNIDTVVRLTNNPDSSQTPAICAFGLGVHVVWSDHRDGNDEIYYKRNPTGNMGVEEKPVGSRQKAVGRIKITPNPFVTFATAPGHEGERFSLYDISGRMVGTYFGNRIGEGLAAGVYFLRSSNNKDKPLRVVKLR